MSLFNKNKSPSETAIEIVKYLDGCNCEVIPPTKDTESLWNKYIEAYNKGKKDGFVPVYIVSDKNVLEVLKLNLEDSEFDNMKDYRKSLINSELPDAESFFKERFDEYAKYYDLNDLYSEVKNVKVENYFSSWTEYNSYFPHPIRAEMA